MLPPVLFITVFLSLNDFLPKVGVNRRGPYYLYYQIKIVQGGVANSKSPLCAPQSRKVGPDILS